MTIETIAFWVQVIGATMKTQLEVLMAATASASSANKESDGGTTAEGKHLEAPPSASNHADADLEKPPSASNHDPDMADIDENLNDELALIQEQIDALDVELGLPPKGPKATAAAPPAKRMRRNAVGQPEVAPETAHVATPASAESALGELFAQPVAALEESVAANPTTGSQPQSAPGVGKKRRKKKVKRRKLNKSASANANADQPETPIANAEACPPETAILSARPKTAIASAEVCPPGTAIQSAEPQTAIASADGRPPQTSISVKAPPASSNVISGISTKMEPQDDVATTTAKKADAMRSARMSFSRTLLPSMGLRRSTTEKIPQSIADKIKSDPSLKDHYFHLWMNSKCSWALVEISELIVDKESTHKRSKKQWLNRGQLLDHFKLPEIVEAIIAEKTANPDTWKPCPDAPSCIIAHQYFLTVLEEVDEELSHMHERATSLRTQLDQEAAKSLLPGRIAKPSWMHTLGVASPMTPIGVAPPPPSPSTGTC